MLRAARFALFAGLSAAMPVVFALDPPHKQGQNKQESKAEGKKSPPPAAEAPKDASPDSGDDRLHRHSRMKERNREIDSMLNKQKK